MWGYLQLKCKIKLHLCLILTSGTFLENNFTQGENHLCLLLQNHTFRKADAYLTSG